MSFSSECPDGNLVIIDSSTVSVADEQIPKRRRLARTSGQQTKNDELTQLPEQKDFQGILPESTLNDGNVNETPHGSAMDREKMTENDKLKLEKNNGELLPVQLCHIGRLPPEILSEIFKHVKNASTIRLVCRFWYDLNNLNETARLMIPAKVCPRFLEDSEIVRMEITFRMVKYLNELPAIFWQKVGPKIHGLTLIYCRLGDEVMKNIILFCDNLKYLKISFIKDVSICDPTTLENVNVVRKQLESLVIDKLLPCSYGADFATWKRLFTVFFEIFPNVVHHGYTHQSKRDDTTIYNMRIKFLTDSSETNPSDLGSCIAKFMCTNSRSEALNAFSVIRLTALSIHMFNGFESAEDDIALGRLLKSQKNLTSVRLRISCPMGEDDRNFIMQKIIDNCSQLCYFECHQIGNNYVPDVFIPPPEWINKIFKISKILNIRHGSGGCIKLSASRMELNGFPLQTSLIQNFNYVQHLNLNQASDELLQSIFQHMIDLKTLTIAIRSGNTNFGFSGRRPLSNDEDLSNSKSKLENSSVQGYSISRLQNLEQLKIVFVACNYSAFTSAIYEEFRFPKLHYLHCFTSEDQSSFALPSVKKIDFVSPRAQLKGTEISVINHTVKYLVNFCRFTANLHTLRVLYVRDFSTEQVKQIFGVCPSLKRLESRLNVYYFHPYTNELRITMSSRNPYLIYTYNISRELA